MGGGGWGEQALLNTFLSKKQTEALETVSATSAHKDLYDLPDSFIGGDISPFMLTGKFKNPSPNTALQQCQRLLRKQQELDH